MRKTTYQVTFEEVIENLGYEYTTDKPLLNKDHPDYQTDWHRLENEIYAELDGIYDGPVQNISFEKIETTKTYQLIGNLGLFLQTDATSIEDAYEKYCKGEGKVKRVFWEEIKDQDRERSEFEIEEVA